ncbi:hypothetical protein CRUP_011682 [Coryphaenoides rupestris]|nr:hypothetical protein CRUP_011682 [Coryphaenoides rupestris]
MVEEEEGLGMMCRGGAQRPLSGGGRSPLCTTLCIIMRLTRSCCEDRHGCAQESNTFLSLTPERSHAGLHETLALLTSQLRPDANHQEDMVFLQNVFSEKSLGYLMKIHEKLRQYERQSPSPVMHSASALAEDNTFLSLTPERSHCRVLTARSGLSCYYTAGEATAKLGYKFNIHEKLRQYERQSPSPVMHSASALAEDGDQKACCNGGH